MVYFYSLDKPQPSGRCLRIDGIPIDQRYFFYFYFVVGKLQTTRNLGWVYCYIIV